MVPVVRVELKGLHLIEAAMRELPDRVSRKMLNDGLLLAARLVRDDAKQRAPRLEGDDPRWLRGQLRRSIRATRIRPREYSAEVIVSVRRLSKRALARIKRRQLKARAEGKNVRIGGRYSGDPFYWRFVEFGTARMRARPFLRPAFDAQKQKAVEAAIKFYRDQVQTELAKLGRRSGA